MKTFLTMIKQLPKNIIFREEERLSLDGFRWAPKTFLSKDSRRLFIDLQNRSATCTRVGLFGEYLAFRPLQPQTIHVIPAARTTIIDNSLDPVRWFDVHATHMDARLDFTDIILLPDTCPDPIYGTAVVAAAVVFEEPSKEILVSAQKRHGHVELFCRVVAVLTLSVLRPLLPPHPSSDGIIHGRFKRTKVLFK